MGGYMGKLLRVNLSDRTAREEALDANLARDYVGGAGLGLRLAYDEVPPEAEPLGPQAKLFIMNGPVTATGLSTAGRYEVVCKAPLTGILCDSSSGGFWGAELKQAGFDGVILEGRSERPVYLYINNGQVQFRDAAHLWGTDALGVQDTVRGEVGEAKARVLAIGPAGERGVLYSCMINDAGRAPGRGGNGAVMGAMGLKAIAVRGTQEVPLADADAYRATVREINKRMMSEDMRAYGTAQVMDNDWPLSDIPTKNWSLGSQEELCRNLGGKKMAATILVPDVACYRCTIGCSRWVKIPSGAFAMDGPGPEYETLGALGSMCMVDDLEAVSYANHLCNIYGMDTISCGCTIAFAMEAFDKGLLTRADTGGIELTWGNKQALVQVVEMIGRQEGIGKLLGQGSRRAAQQLGGDALDYAVQVKGMENPMHDPRAFYAWAATYATGPRGACHLHGMSAVYENKEAPEPEWGLDGFYERHSDDNKAHIARLAQDWAHIVNSMVVCYFAGFNLHPSDLAALLNQATGTSLTPDDLITIGDRINALHRAYNYRCGIRRADDWLPKRSLMPLAEGGAAGKVPDLGRQLEEYYKERRWEPDGKPSLAALLDLGLADVAKDLYP